MGEVGSVRGIVRSAVVIGAVLFGSVLGAPAQASNLIDSTLTTVADWQMDEPSTSTAMTDSSGYGFTGAIGDLVRRGMGHETGTAYHFDANWKADPVAARLVVVPNDPDGLLDPGTGYYSIEMRFRTSKADSNIVQKGQSETSGGMWKIGLNKLGYIGCHFRDVNHTTKAVRPQIAVHDGQWHTILCERTPTGVAMTIDGFRRYRSGALGSIDNRLDLAVGGKLYCNWADVGCDPFVGDIDYIKIRRDIA